MLKKLDGLQLADIFAGDRLKKFYPHQKLRLNKAPDFTYEVMPTFKNFFADDNNKFFDVADNFLWSLDYKLLFGALEVFFIF